MSSANADPTTKKSKDKSNHRSSKNGSPYKNDSDEPGIVVVSDQGSNQERPFREELQIGGIYQDFKAQASENATLSVQMIQKKQIAANPDPFSFVNQNEFKDSSSPDKSRMSESA